MKTLTLASLLVASLFVFSGFVAAQDVAQTRFETEVHPPENAAGWAGENMTGSLDAQLCWESPGGLNPEDESFNVSVGLDQDLPDGFTVQVVPDAFDLTPPNDPADGGCTDPYNVTVTFDWQDGVQPDTTVNVNVTLSVDDDATAGTFQAPEDGTATFTLQTVPSSDLPPDGDGNGTDDDDEENGSPMPGVALLLLATYAMVIMRRARER